MRRDKTIALMSFFVVVITFFWMSQQRLGQGRDKTERSNEQEIEGNEEREIANVFVSPSMKRSETWRDCERVAQARRSRMDRGRKKRKKEKSKMKPEAISQRGPEVAAIYSRNVKKKRSVRKEEKKRWKWSQNVLHRRKIWKRK